MEHPLLIMVHGIFRSRGSGSSEAFGRLLLERSGQFAEHGASIGVIGYEQITGSGRAIANRFLRMARGTARAVDAVEVFEIEEAHVRRALTDRSLKDIWGRLASCGSDAFDLERSFVMAGRPRILVDGPVTGQRVLWFGRGLSTLSDDEFIEHYTGFHGPLVAGYADVLGIRRYRQVANDHDALCAPLRELGFGQAKPPPTFAEMTMAMPPMTLSSIRSRRLATRAIKADEKRHIDFEHSMLLLA